MKMGVVPASIWCGKALGIPRTERLSLWRKMTEAAGKGPTVFWSLCLKMSDLETDAYLACMTALFWAEQYGTMG